MPPEYVFAGRPAASVSSEAREQLSRASGRPRARHAVQPPDHHEVLQAREVLVDRRVLPGQPDLLAQRRRVAHGIQAGDADLARVWLEQRRHHAHRRRLAGAVGPQQPQHRAWRGLKIDAIQRAHVTEGLAQPSHADREVRICALLRPRVGHGFFQSGWHGGTLRAVWARNWPQYLTSSAQR
jgi:hypothetical protein